MRRTLLTTITIFSFIGQFYGQSLHPESEWHTSIDTLFSKVLEHNRTLIAAKEIMEATKLESRTGNTPNDPTLELGYLSGFPEALGNRLDFRVSQEFDFPTAYFQRARAKDIRSKEAEQVYALTRQEIKARAMELWIQRISLLEIQSVYLERLEIAAQLKDHYQLLLDAGEVGKLSFHQTSLQLTSLIADLEEVRAGINVNKEALMEITDGKMDEITVTSLPSSSLPGKDEILSAWAGGPEMQIYARQIELREQLGKLAVSQSLPKFSAGYYSETVIDERFRGVHAGVSIPLWENSNKVKHARARVSQAEAEYYAFQRTQQMELAQLLEEWKGLDRRIKELQQALDEVNAPELLSVALKVGEISLSEFIFSSEYYFQNLRKLLEYKRDQLLIENTLMKVGY